MKHTRTNEVTSADGGWRVLMQMKTVTGVMLALLCGWMTAAGQENLLKDGGFEGVVTEDGRPGSGWWLYQGLGVTEVKVDRTVAHGGRASVRLRAAAEAKCVLVSQRFGIVPGDEIRFEAWVRGEHLPPTQNSTYAGLAFRKVDNNVFAWAYFRPQAVNGDWSLISGVAKAPAGASTAEVHLGYTNAPGTLWFDDASAIIANPLSFSLVQVPKPWAGEQEISMLVANRQTNEFRGSVSAAVGREAKMTPVIVPPMATREVAMPITLNSLGAHEYKLSLLDADEKPLRVLEGKFRISAPLALYPACPCFHPAGESKGDTRIEAKVNVNPARRAGLRLRVTLVDAAGNQLQAAMADVSQKDTAGLNLQVPTEVPSVFGIDARLVDRAGKELARANTDVHVILRSEARVTVGPDGFLRVGGQAHFPIGMYSCGRYEDMGKAGFSATHNYGITTGEPDEQINPNDSNLKELLDRSWTNRMRMMVELPRKAIEKAQWEQVRRRIETFRHHPGLLCWGSEERVARGQAPLANIVALYRLVQELDPDHPLVLGDTKDVIQKLQKDRRDFFPDACMDAGIWWWYPIPIKSAGTNALEGQEQTGGLLTPPSWLTTTISKKPLWIAIQAYQKPAKEGRFPTPAEYRCQAYLSIINGVKGLFFYTGSGERDHEGKPSGLLNKPLEGHWDYVKKLAGELGEFSPVIMASRCAANVAMSPAEAPVEFAVRELDGKVYLIAANKSGRPQKVRFSSDALKGRKAQVLYETHPVAVEGDALADEFPGFGVHVYRIE